MIQGNHVEELDYHVHNKLLYHLGKLCVPQGESVNAIKESHTSLITSHFGVGKTIEHSQRYCYWSRMNEAISRYVKGCSMCATNKPTNEKLGLYTPLHIPSHPWESISMDFVGGLLMSRKGHDYLYVFVDHFSKMCMLQLKKLQRCSVEMYGCTLGYPFLLFFIDILDLSRNFGQVYGNSWTPS